MIGNGTCDGASVGSVADFNCPDFEYDYGDINQNNIIKFIEYCKTFENEKGYLTQSFFKTIITKKAKFISGPFTNMIFEILEKQKNKLKILVGNIVTTIPNKVNYLYRPI